MPDQAEKLRQMIHEDCGSIECKSSGPPMVAVTGGKGGVGATSVAMNLAAALADRGHRVVLVEATRHHADLMQLAGIHFCGGSTLADVLTGKVSVLDALAPGPAGTLLLADRWAPRTRTDYSGSAQQRLLVELQSLDETIADILIVDTGSGYTPWTRRFWQRAEVIILPTTSEDVAVMDTYATIKLGTEAIGEADLCFLLNRCDSRRLGEDAERRLKVACQRFLGRAITALPSLPSHESQVAEDIDREPPRIWETPDSPFGHATLWLGRAVSDILERRSFTIEKQIDAPAPGCSAVFSKAVNVG